MGELNLGPLVAVMSVALFLFIAFIVWLWKLGKTNKYMKWLAISLSILVGGYIYLSI